MLRQLKNYVQQIINTGVKEDTPWNLANRVQITNLLFVIVIPFVLLNVIINIFQKDIIGLIVCFVWVLLASSILFQNKRQRFYFIFIYIIVVFTLMTDVVLVIIGRAANISPMYIISILMTLFFFEKRKYIIAFISYIIANYFIAHFILDNFKTIHSTVSPIETHFYFFVSVWIMVAITLRVLNENKKRIRETEKLLKEVENKNRELERFAYITSHDLKEPLRNIAGFSGLLERKLANDKDTETQEYLSFIKNNAIQLNTLMDSILDFVNVSNSKQHEISNLKLSTIIAEASQNIIEIVKEKNATIDCVSSVEFKGVECQFVTLFQHLLENSIKFNKDRMPTVTIDVNKTAENYIFKIKDNGIGIEECYHQKVFIPFKKLHNKSDYDGAGIGLSICQRIVEQHEGRFWVESMVGEGSTFYFSIPRPV